MTGVHKRFSKSLHQANDPKSRTVVKAFFARPPLNTIVEDNPNKFGVDLISKDGKLQVEVEHRLVWTEDEFPYDEVNLPERKAKFFTADHIAYVILSAGYTHIGMIGGEELRKHIIDDNLKESSNKFVRANEYFYKIPKSAFEWAKL